MAGAVALHGRAPLLTHYTYDYADEGGRAREQSVFSLVVASSLHAAPELLLGFLSVLQRYLNMSNHVFSIQSIHELDQGQRALHDLPSGH